MVAFAAVLPLRLTAQIRTTTVQGTVYRADGTPASGTVLISWPAFTTPQNQAVAAGSTSATIGADGFVSVNLTPNAGSLPAGNYYTAVYHLSDGTVTPEYWVVPSSGTAAIASVRAQLQPSTVAVQPVSEAYVSSAIASLGSSWLPLVGGTLTGPLSLNTDPTTSSQAATKHYVDQSSAAQLPLAGGTLTGPLSGQKSTFKLPRVDVTHPDFGAAAGCASVYSACAINAALAFRSSQCANSTNPSQCPSVVLPEGTYTLEATIKWPMNTTLMGDGTQSTTLLLPSGANYPAITAEPTDATTTMWPFFGQIRDLTIAGKDHTSSGTGIDLEMGNPGGGAAFIKNVNFYNLGGVGIAISEQAEKTVCDTCTFEYVRQPIIAIGDSLRFPNLGIAWPGRNADGYVWNVNCPNGVCPGSGAIAPENRHAAIYVFGDQDWFSHVECKPLALEPCFKFINGNNTGIDGGYLEGYQFGYKWSGSVNSSILHPGAPDQGDGNGTVASCSVGTNTYGCVPSSHAADPWNDWWPYVIGDPANIHGALLDTTGTYRGVAYIFCQDYSAGSATPCASNPGVQQGQWEEALVVLSQGKWYLTNRNLPGSTAPSSTAWVNPHFEFPAVTDIGQAIQIKNVSLQGVNLGAFATGYTQNCTDATLTECAEVKVGGIDDNYISYRFGPNDPNGTSPGTNINISSGMTFTAIAPHAPGAEVTGYGWLKTNARGGAIFYTGAVPASAGETSEISTGNGTLTGNAGAGAPLPFAFQITSGKGGVGTDGGVSYNNGAQTGTGTPAYLAHYNAAAPSYLGNNPNWSWGIGTQFFNSNCTAGVATSGGANFRSCILDSNNSGGPGVVWQTTTNGNTAAPTWTTVATLSASGLTGNWLNLPSLTASNVFTGTNKFASVSASSLAGASINGEITVDGTTYATLNAAWSAALSQATSTGHDQTVRLGPGTFPVTATLTEPTNGACVSLLGSGGTTVNADSSQVATTLTVPSSLGGDVFLLGNTAQAQGCTFKDLNILAGGNATHAFELQWFRGALLDNVTVNDTTSDGILLGEENTASGHQANFLLRNITVSYSSAAFTPANRPAYGVHLQKTAIDSHLDNITVRNALTAAVYNEGTGNTGYLIHGFGYPYTCTTAPCANNASSGTAANASYATSYVVYDTGGSGSVWTDTYADSPAVSGFYVGANGVEIHGGHIQWPDLTSFPAANLAYVASAVTNNLLVADVDCLGMAAGVNWITYGGASGNPPTYTSVHHLTGCGNYYQALEDANVTGYSSGGANINDPTSAVPRVWSTPIASGASYPAYAAQFYTGYQGDVLQAHFSGVNPFFNVTYQGTIRSNGGLALSTIINTASTLTLTAANKNVIANAASGAQTITLPSCYTALPDKAAPTGLEFTIIKSDTSSNAVTLQTVSSQNINYNGISAQTLAISAPGKRTLVCAPDYNWYAY